jgi:hypothetical protein
MVVGEAFLVRGDNGGNAETRPGSPLAVPFEGHGMAGGTRRELKMTEERARSPRITGIAWGSVRIEGRERPFKDVKLYPGGAREWDWRETGTDHRPGVQPADVQELLDHGASVVVIAQGFNQQLEVRDETRDMLEERGVALHVLPTEKAVELYNELREKEPAGALIHSTC